MQRVQIGISTYNEHRYLSLLLQSIRWYTYLDDEGFDLVVCDDGTTNNDVVEETRKVCAYFGATFIRHERNMGIPATWNHLVEALHGDIIVLLNNDLLMPPNWLRVAVYFLDANKDNPHVGSCFWNPINRVPYGAMQAILPILSHTLFLTADQLTNNDLGYLAEQGVPNVSSLQGDGQGLGRVMCPCGCCFAFTRAVWDEVGTFDERLTSFHEESDWGTRCASYKRASFGFAYPRPYHTHGYTFGANPELQASERMRASRALYREKWRVPDTVGPHEYFNFVNEQLMTQIPKTPLRYLAPDYSSEPETRQLPGGETIYTPRLVEHEGEF